MPQVKPMAKVNRDTLVLWVMRKAEKVAFFPFKSVLLRAGLFFMSHPFGRVHLKVRKRQDDALGLLVDADGNAADGESERS